jgi:hypothetical protein
LFFSGDVPCGSTNVAVKVTPSTQRLRSLVWLVLVASLSMVRLSVATVRCCFLPVATKQIHPCVCVCVCVCVFSSSSFLNLSFIRVFFLGLDGWTGLAWLGLDWSSLAWA